jgi:hypothetical protein
MASEAQVTANSANAQRSTGPSTDTGKARASQNACKHGFTAAELHVPDDQREELEEFQTGVVASINPANDIERNLTKQLVATAWKIQRLQVLEAELLAGDDPLRNEANSKALDRVTRYLTTAERSYHRTMTELRELQTNRWLAKCDEVDPLLPALAPLTNALKIKRARAPHVNAKHFAAHCRT